MLKPVMLVLLVTTIAVAGTGFVSGDFQISKNLEIFAKVIRELNTHYVDDIKTGELVQTGIEAMLEELDPYTVFMPESQMEDIKLLTRGEYGGVGSVVQQRGEYTEIQSVYEGFPAHKAGLKPGDRFLEVAGNSVVGRTTGQVSDLLKGQAGSEVQVKVLRTALDDTISLTLTRENIKMDNIPYAGVIHDNLGYIRLSQFTEKAGQEVKDAFMELREKNELNGLVIDLRNNGGGLLDEAVKIVNLFVPKGEMVVETRGKLKERNRVHRTTDDPADTEIPLVILINGRSASASEIVAGALQDLDRAVVIGETSFGKGLVQNILNLSYNTRMKVTVAKYFIPSGRCVQAVDYSKINASGDVPDSLKQKFTTRGGRPVYDGAGIYPDLEVKRPKYQPISVALINQRMIFDFVTRFYYSNDSIQPPEIFQISHSLYEELEQYLQENDFTYQTGTEKKLQEFMNKAEEEGYLENVEPEHAVLKDALFQGKADDLHVYRNEIETMLRNEILGRYYFQKGSIIASLNNDPKTLKAVEVLTSPEIYNRILAPPGN